ncbi:MAG TPA: hypothetical protein DCY93_03705 [Firmicutes bacterium]|nr:hypothetical protein [Bacillota bacterium]
MENTDKNELFSKNIKYMRKKMNLKQEELAEKLYVTPQAVSKWETCKSIPDVKMLITISNLFKVSVDQLLNEDLELSNKEETEQEVELAEEIEVENNVNIIRNILVFNKKGKSYKAFLITSILFFIFFAAVIPTAFFPYDIYTVVVLIVAAILNTIIFAYQINIMCHLNEVGKTYLSSTIEHRKMISKICLPINFALIIFETAVYFILLDYPDNSMLFYHLYLIISLSLLSITESLNYVYYDQALQDAERI